VCLLNDFIYSCLANLPHLGRPTCCLNVLNKAVPEFEWNGLNKYQRNQIKSFQSEIRRKYFQLSFLAVCLAGTTQINPHRNNVPQGQDLAKVSSPHFTKTGIIQSWAFSANMWAAAKGSEVTRLKKTTFTNKAKGETLRGKKGKEWKIWLSILSSTPKELSFHNPVSLSPFLFFSKFFLSHKNEGNV